MDFKEIVKEKQKELNITNNHLATLANLHPMVVSRLRVTGENKMSFNNVLKIAEVLDIDLNQFKEGKNDTYRD